MYFVIIIVAGVLFATGRVVASLIACLIGFPMANIVFMFIKREKKENVRDTVLTGLFGLALIAGFIWANIKRSRKYKVDVPAECTGYARRIEKRASIAMLIAGLSCLLFAAVPVIVVYVFTFVK